MMMTEIGLLLSDATVCFESKENCLINLEGETKGKSYGNFDINLDWDFQKMGVGGLDENLTAIFRRAFASRVFPPETIEKIGCKHVRGILMYGPPGTGKTLIARKIGNMLNTTQPKIVNGPEILNKYVGEAEANIRKLFADAEFEQKKFGMKSNLHMIIFDEIDAICKVRGSVSNSSGVHDTIVNQLLSKMDGINQLNNILIIGMTNRRDMIDEALLRPGRFEVQIEIGLPDENGRLKILEIHTSKMKENSMLPDIDLKYLAKHTKNFTGAEIEGLTKSASSWAMYKYLKPESSEKIKTNFDSVEIEITMADFLHALEHDIKPAFGSSIEQVDSFLSQDIILWGSPVSFVLNEGELFVKQVNSPEMIGVVSVLLEGSPNSGKTALAAKIAKNSCFPFVKVCSPEDMIGYSESDKCLAIKKLFDNAHKSPVSCIIIDNIERLLDYTAVGPHFSNSVLQSLLILLKKEPPKGRRLLILGTTSNKVVLESMELVSAFTETIHVPNLSCIEHLMAVLENTKCFNEEERNDIKEKVSNHRFSIPIKKLLRYVDMAKQIDGSSRVDRFVSKLRNTFL
ncbi:NSF (predicted) [Pycnogonum litorale]